jgi:hypothetical protein
VQRDLTDARMGELRGLDRRTCSMRAQGIEPAEVESPIQAGSPLITYLVGGRLVRHDQEDARPAWADARSADGRVAAGRWESPEGSPAVVLVFPG